MPSFEQVGVEATVRGFAQYMRQMGQMGRATQNFNRTTGRIAGGGGVISKAITGIGLAAAGAALAVGAAATAIGVQSVKIATSFETAFAGVLKTTEGLGDNLYDLTSAGETVFQQFRDLAKEIPLSFEELSSIGELAGQLGIPEQALAGFTDTVARLGVTTNLTTEDAATQIAKLQNIYAVSADDMSESTANVGNVLVELGNNFATTEADIIAFGQRIASAGKIAGFTQADVLAVGAALSAVGVEAEAGGTAVQKALISIEQAVAGGGKKLNVLAETAGLTSKEFADAWETDAAGAFNQFIIGLGEAGNDAFTILDDLDIGNQRSIRSFLALAGAGDLLTETLASANEQWEGGTALVDESEKRFATFQSQVDLMKNKFRDMGATIGMALIPKLLEIGEKFAPVLDNIAEKLPGIIDNVIGFFENIDVGSIVGNIQEVVGNIVDAFKTGDFSQLLGGTELSGFADGFGRIVDTVKSFADTVGEVIGNIVDDTLPKLVDWWNKNRPTLEKAFDNISKAFEFVGQVFEAVVKTIEPLVEGLISVFLSIITFVGSIFAGEWENVWENFKAIFQTAADTVVATIIAWWDNIGAIFGTSYQGILDGITAWIANILLKIIEFKNNAVQFFVDLWEGIKSTVATKKEEVVNFFVEFATGVRDKLVEFVGNIATWVADTKEKFDNFKEKAKELKDDVVKFFQELPGTLKSYAINAIQSLYDGMVQKWNDVRGKISELIGSIISFIQGLLGIGSPSKVFMGIGSNIMEGLALGINNAEGLAKEAIAGASVEVAHTGAIGAAAGAGSVVNNTNNTINANYSQTQSPATIADDLILLGMMS